MEKDSVTTISERDILISNVVTAHVSTAAVLYAPEVSTRKAQSRRLDYLSSAQLVTERQASAETVSAVEEPNTAAASPVWLRRVKRRIKELARLPANWDSYGAVPIDPRIAGMAEALAEWFAVADMPPPDVFAMSDGGVQFEWHIRRVNVEIEMSPFEGTTLYFQDLDAGMPWSRQSSDTDLQTIRRRLLKPL